MKGDEEKENIINKEKEGTGLFTAAETRSSIEAIKNQATEILH